MQIKSIKLPIGEESTLDSEGFENKEIKFLKGIPANFKDTTRSDEVLAKQCGYEVSVVVEIMACTYNGASFLVDESNGDIYDINRVHHPDKGMIVELTTQRREHGKL